MFIGYEKKMTGFHIRYLSSTNFSFPVDGESLKIALTAAELAVIAVHPCTMLFKHNYKPSHLCYLSFLLGFLCE